jgi:hypothetical protein
MEAFSQPNEVQAENAAVYEQFLERRRGAIQEGEKIINRDFMQRQGKHFQRGE